MMLLTDVCLSVVYIGRNSRTERPRKTKIGKEVAHVTRDSDTTFKVKRSKVKVTRPLWLVVLTGQREHTVMVTYPYAYMTYIVSPLAGLGVGISWRPPASSLLSLLLLLLYCYYFLNYLQFNCFYSRSESVRCCLCRLQYDNGCTCWCNCSECQ